MDDETQTDFCPRCGSSMVWTECEACGGEGVDGHDCGEDCCCCLMPEDNVPCQYCRGIGGWWECCADPDWCEANPLPEALDQAEGGTE